MKNQKIYSSVQASKFSNNTINKFISQLKTGAYLCECMDERRMFDETSLHEKEEFYSNLNM